jgi:hypothetical protein
VSVWTCWREKKIPSLLLPGFESRSSTSWSGKYTELTRLPWYYYGTQGLTTVCTKTSPTGLPTSVTISNPSTSSLPISLFIHKSVTRLQAGGSGFGYLQRKGFFSSPPRPDRAWGPPSFLFIGYRGLFLRGVKRPGREAAY